MSRVGVVSQARMTSTRLPGKVLKEAGGDSMLGHHVRRLQDAGLAVYLAITTNRTDEPLASFAEDRGIPVFQGSEDDVLGRYAGAARSFDLDVIVRVTSDCPFIDGAVVRRAIDEFERVGHPRAYISNVVERTYPRGFDFEIFSRELLLEADERATEAFEREHVTPYMRMPHREPAVMRHVRRAGDASHFRVTLDTPEDWELIRRLVEEHQAQERSAEEIIAILEQRPDLASLNAHIEQKKLGE